MTEVERAQKDLDEIIKSIQAARLEARELGKRIRFVRGQIRELKVALSNLEREIMEVLKP